MRRGWPNERTVSVAPFQRRLRHNTKRPNAHIAVKRLKNTDFASFTRGCCYSCSAARNSHTCHPQRTSQHPTPPRLACAWSAVRRVRPLVPGCTTAPGAPLRRGPVVRVPGLRGARGLPAGGGGGAAGEGAGAQAEGAEAGQARGGHLCSEGRGQHLGQLRSCKCGFAGVAGLPRPQEVQQDPPSALDRRCAASVMRHARARHTNVTEAFLS